MCKCPCAVLAVCLIHKGKVWLRSNGSQNLQKHQGYLDKNPKDDWQEAGSSVADQQSLKAGSRKQEVWVEDKPGCEELKVCATGDAIKPDISVQLRRGLSKFTSTSVTAGWVNSQRGLNFSFISLKKQTNKNCWRDIKTVKTSTRVWNSDFFFVHMQT